jgi:hypothetical protein
MTFLLDQLVTLYAETDNPAHLFRLGLCLLQVIIGFSVLELSRWLGLQVPSHFPSRPPLSLNYRASPTRFSKSGARNTRSHQINCRTHTGTHNDTFRIWLSLCTAEVLYSRNTDKKGDEKSYRTKGPVEKVSRAHWLLYAARRGTRHRGYPGYPACVLALYTPPTRYPEKHKTYSRHKDQKKAVGRFVLVVNMP